MQLIILIEYLILSVILIYIIQTYSNREVSWLVKLIVFIAWSLSIGMVMLLPLDIYYTLHSANSSAQHESNALQILQVTYFIMYWTVYIFSWTVIPILQGYEESGLIDKWERFR